MLIHLINSIFNTLLGLLIGAILHSRMQLFLSNWLAGLATVLMIGLMLIVIYLAEHAIDWLFEKLFPSGIRRSYLPSSQQGKTVKPPWRRWAFPAGLFLGYVLSLLNIVTLDVWVR